MTKREARRIAWQLAACATEQASHDDPKVREQLQVVAKIMLKRSGIKIVRDDPDQQKLFNG